MQIGTLCRKSPPVKRNSNSYAEFELRALFCVIMGRGKQRYLTKLLCSNSFFVLSLEG